MKGLFANPRVQKEFSLIDWGSREVELVEDQAVDFELCSKSTIAGNGDGRSGTTGIDPEVQPRGAPGRKTPII
jgi:hypothetical protein